MSQSNSKVLRIWFWAHNLGERQIPRGQGLTLLQAGPLHTMDVLSTSHPVAPGQPINWLCVKLMFASQLLGCLHLLPGLLCDVFDLILPNVLHAFDLLSFFPNPFCSLKYIFPLYLCTKPSQAFKTSSLQDQITWTKSWGWGGVG